MALLHNEEDDRNQKKIKEFEGIIRRGQILVGT